VVGLSAVSTSKAPETDAGGDGTVVGPGDVAVKSMASGGRDIGGATTGEATVKSI
jgi:hypothetical protein